MTMFTCISLFVLGAQRGTLPEPHVVEKFREVVCRSGDRPIVYRLFCPDSRGPWPLIVWFHGRGEAGDDNQKQLAWLELMLENSGRPFPACVVALQRPAPLPRWLSHHPGSGDAFELLDEVLTDVMAHHAIDPDRVILSGISSGGSAVWAYAQRHPHRFSALAPLATTVVPEQVESLTSIPIWAFQSAADGDASVENVGQFVDRLRQQGGPAHLTIIKSQTHDCWTQAFKDYGLTDWMFSQSPQSSEGTGSTVSANSKFRNSWFRRKSCYRIMLSGFLLVIAFVGISKLVGIRPLSRG